MKKQVLVEKINKNQQENLKTVIKQKESKVEITEELKNKPKGRIILGRSKKSSMISINSSFKSENEKTEEKEVDISSLRHNNFTETELLKFWKELIVFVKEQGKFNLGITLGVHPVKLLANYLVEFPLSNAAQQEMIAEEKYMILEFLRNKLENDNIEIITKIIEGENNNIPYTNKDKFKKMLEENPDLEILRLKLGLDPDY